MKKLLSIFITAMLASGLYAQSISPALLKKVKAEGELQKVFLNDNKVELQFTPDTELSSLAINHWDNSEKPRLTTEKLL